MADPSVENDANPNSHASKVERSRAAVEATLKYLRTHRPSVRLRRSPIAALIQDRADEIRAALESGWSAGAIARVLHERGVGYTADSIRLRIAKMFAAHPAPPKKRSERSELHRTLATGKAQVATTGGTKREARPSASATPAATMPDRPGTTHAAFEDDPR